MYSGGVVGVVVGVWGVVVGVVGYNSGWWSKGCSNPYRETIAYNACIGV